MATKFTLSKPKDKALPETVEVDGSAFHIDWCFRNILRILRMLEDDEVAESHRPALLLKWFYRDGAPQDVEAAINAFMWFLHRGDVPSGDPSGEPPVFDHEQDAVEVYSSFVALYGIDLFESNMHWWQFCALLDGAMTSDTSLSAKIRLRMKDASKCDEPEKVRKAQDAIRIENRYTRAERAMKDKLYAVLTGGGDVSAALEAIKQNGI